MSSHDPYAGLPNLARSSGSIEDIRSAGDPSRFFPSAARGQIDAVTGRILNKPRCFVSRQAAHNIANGGTLQFITFDTVVRDDEGLWDASNPTVLTLKTPGEYTCTGFAVWPSNSTNFRQIFLVVNGVARFADIIAPQPVTTSSQQITREVELNAGDELQLALAQNTTTNPLVLPASPAMSVYDHGLQIVLSSTFGSDNQ